MLCLTRYDAAGASSRYRFYQYIPFLRDAGIRVDEAPLLGRRYVDGLYQRGRRNFAEMARAALNRLRALAGTNNYDLLWVEKEFLPWLPSSRSAWFALQAFPWSWISMTPSFISTIGTRGESSAAPLVGKSIGRWSRLLWS